MKTTASLIFAALVLSTAALYAGETEAPLKLQMELSLTRLADGGTASHCFGRIDHWKNISGKLTNVQTIEQPNNSSGRSEFAIATFGQPGNGKPVMTMNLAPQDLLYQPAEGDVLVFQVGCFLDDIRPGKSYGSNPFNGHIAGTAQIKGQLQIDGARKLWTTNYVTKTPPDVSYTQVRFDVNFSNGQFVAGTIGNFVP